MRASSWGDFGEYGRFVCAQEVASMYSGTIQTSSSLLSHYRLYRAVARARSSSRVSLRRMVTVNQRSPLAAARRIRLWHPDRYRADPTGPGFGFRGSPVVVGGSRWRSSPHRPRSPMQLSSSLSSEEGESGMGEGEGEGDDNADSDSFCARSSEGGRASASRWA